MLFLYDFIIQCIRYILASFSDCFEQLWHILGIACMWTKYSAHVNFVVSSIFLMIILLSTYSKTILSFLSIVQCWGLPSKFHLFVYMTNFAILRQHCWCTEYHLHICQVDIWSAHFDPQSPCKHCELCSQLSINCFVAFWGTPNCNLWPTWEVWNTNKRKRIPPNALATLQRSANWVFLRSGNT